MLILYNPPSSSERKPVLPMSLLALGALLEERHDYLIIDGNLEPDPLESIDRAIRETGADILAVTVMPGPQLSHAVPQCRHLKARHPDLTIIWGGYFPTQHYDVCLCADYVDYVIVGHGEQVLRDVLDALRLGREPEAIPGVAYRSSRSDSVSFTGTAPIPHPDQLPDFPYHRVDAQRYHRRTFLGNRTLSHHSSYGCPFLCNFCAVVNLGNGRWLAQSAERTASTTRYLVNQFGADAIDFHDNNFFVSEERTAEFADRICDLGISWWGESRIDTLLKYSDASWELIRESGLKMAFLGAESGSDETLRAMDKGGTASVEKTLSIAEKMAQVGIIPEFSFVLGNPPDPEADAHQTLEFIRSLKRVNPASEIILYFYTPVPLAGSLFEEARSQGFRFPKTLEEWIGPEWLEFSQRRSSLMPWATDPLRRRIQNFERVLNAYYPTSTDLKLTRSIRLLLRALASWRYQLRIYGLPVELALIHRLIPYRRPETSGF